MKELIVYYSFSGKTKKYAEELAKSRGAETCEIIEAKKRGMLGAFFIGCPQSRGLKRVPIKPAGVNFGDYDKITLAAPVWAGRQAPAINSAIDLIPEGKEVEIVLVSTSGGGDGETIAEMVKSRGCSVTDVKKIRA